MNNTSSKKIAAGGMIAALYVVLTIISSLFGLSSGVIQLRLSEALCILPCFTSAAVPGLFIGCIISNIITGSAVIDVIFGSLATLIGAVITYLIRKRRFLSSLPPIISNTIILPFALKYAYGLNDAVLYIAITIFIGECLSAGLLGQILYSFLNKRPSLLKKFSDISDS